MSACPQPLELYTLVAQMNTALDNRRWRRLPSLHRTLMLRFNRYQQQAPEDELVLVKARLKTDMQALIARREMQAEDLKQRMELMATSREGQLAYSISSLWEDA